MKCNECVGLGLFRFNKQTASARKYAAHFNHEELNGSEFLSNSFDFVIQTDASIRQLFADAFVICLFFFFCEL